MANRFPDEIREDLTNWLHNICKPCHSSERICQLHQGNYSVPSSYTPSFNIVLSQDELFDKSCFAPAIQKPPLPTLSVGNILHGAIGRKSSFQQPTKCTKSWSNNHQTHKSIWHHFEQISNKYHNNNNNSKSSTTSLVNSTMQHHILYLNASKMMLMHHNS